jgi:hypothetical protein
MSPDPHPQHPTKGSAYLVATHRGRHRGWFQRRRSSRRSRFDLALIGGGAIALLLAATLPGESTGTIAILLVVAGLAMTVVARLVGLAPSIAAAVFAPLVIALTDPMWTLGASITDFTLAEESEIVFATFLAAAVIGSAMRRFQLRGNARSAHALWSATPPEATPIPGRSGFRER